MKKFISLLLVFALLLCLGTAAAEEAAATVATVGNYQIQYVVPEGYELSVDANSNSVVWIADIKAADPSAPQFSIVICYNELYADQTINDLSKEDHAELVALFTADYAEPQVSYGQTGFGTELVIVDENGSASDYVNLFSLYKGYTVDMAVWHTDNSTLSPEDIQMGVQQLTDLQFVEMGEGAAADTTAEDEGGEESFYTYQIEEDGTCTVVGYEGASNALVIAPIYQDVAVTRIGENAFGDLEIVSITIPDSVTEIGELAFQYTYLTSIEIPNSVTLIEDGAFYSCSELTNVTLSTALKEIGDFTFFECTSLAEIVIPGSVETIGESAFNGCAALETVIISEGTTTIKEAAFTNCPSLVSVTIPDSVTTIREAAFASCSDQLVIKGHSGSYAETYAKENALTFAVIPE